jgi:hypothetical protein
MQKPLDNCRPGIRIPHNRQIKTWPTRPIKSWGGRSDLFVQSRMRTQDPQELCSLANSPIIMLRQRSQFPVSKRVLNQQCISL